MTSALLHQNGELTGHYPVADVANIEANLWAF
jgi:hypothetical protein